MSETTSTIDPLADIELGPDELPAVQEVVANLALTMRPCEVYWRVWAKRLLASGILHVLYAAAAHKRSPTLHVAALALNQPERLIEEMAQSPQAYVANIGAHLKRMDERVRAGIVAIAQPCLDPYLAPCIASYPPLA